VWLYVEGYRCLKGGNLREARDLLWQAGRLGVREAQEQLRTLEKRK